MLIPSAHTRREGEPREVWKLLPLRWAGLAEEAGSPEGWYPMGMGVFLMDTLMCWVVSVLLPLCPLPSQGLCSTLPGSLTPQVSVPLSVASSVGLCIPHPRGLAVSRILKLNYSPFSSPPFLPSCLSGSPPTLLWVSVSQLGSLSLCACVFLILSIHTPAGPPLAGFSMGGVCHLGQQLQQACSCLAKGRGWDHGGSDPSSTLWPSLVPHLWDRGAWILAQLASHQQWCRPPHYPIRALYPDHCAGERTLGSSPNGTRKPRLLCLKEGPRNPDIC